MDDERLIERLRRNPSIAPGNLLVHDDRVTSRMVRRAREHDKIFGWVHPHVPDVLETIFEGYVGAHRKKNGHVFVFDGDLYVGVYDATGPEGMAAARRPWVAAVGTEFVSAVRGRSVNHWTIGTMLGGFCEAMIGGRVFPEYIRKRPDPDQMDLLGDATP